MSGESICLTPDEAAAMREIIAALATIEERGLRQDWVIEISREAWRDLLLRPAARLRRITAPRLSESVR